MRRYQVSIKRSLMLIGGIVAAGAMAARGASSWGPLNLVVLAFCLLISATILAFLPIIPHRPFWAGLALFGGLYAGFCFLGEPLFGFNSDHRPLEPLYRRWAESHYGSKPDFKNYDDDRPFAFLERSHKVDGFVDASHAVTSVSLGILGGLALLVLAKKWASRRWDRDALPERALEDFLLPPLKIEPPLQSK